jgi:hypothetical protein
MTLHRVFFDTNAAGMIQGYWLGFDQSQKDLDALSDELREGLRVTIYMPNELEMEAILSFDSTDTVWCAEPIEGTIVYLDGTI